MKLGMGVARLVSASDNEGAVVAVGGRERSSLAGALLAYGFTVSS